MKIEPVLHKFLPALLKFSILFFLAIPNAHAALTNFQAADVVLGQPDFISNADNNGGIGANTLSTPQGTHTEGRRLFVADGLNNRVLIWNTIPSSNRKPADIVLGQPDFSSNTGNNGGRSARSLNNPVRVRVVNGRLAVVDRANNRVLIWDATEQTNFAPAQIVLGQTSPTALVFGVSQVLTRQTRGVAFDGTNLWVVDQQNDRVVRWKGVPNSNGMTMNLVLGHAVFDSGTPNDGGLSAQSLANPFDFWTDGDLFIVTDWGNNRVLIWNEVPTVNFAAADVVIGQANFISNAANNSGVSASSLNLPRSAHSDGKRLFVTDTGNNRVLIWNEIPKTNGAPADIILGQPDFTSSVANNGGLGPQSLNTPYSVHFDGKRLYVADGGNHRILIYNIGSSAIDLGPQFTQGKSVLGKVFWDFNKSGYQDAGEFGVEGVKVVSDTGIYAITDEDGKYHYPFIQVGQRILKLDPITLPVGATVTTENPRKIIVTAGMLTKVSFGLYGEVSEVVTEDNDLLLKVSIAQDPSKLAPQLSVSAEVTEDKIIFTINTNYHLFIKRGELKLFDQNQNLLQTIDLPQPLPLYHEIPVNDDIATFQLSVFDEKGNEDRTSVGTLKT